VFIVRWLLRPGASVSAFAAFEADTHSSRASGGPTPTGTVCRDRPRLHPARLLSLAVDHLPGLAFDIAVGCFGRLPLELVELLDQVVCLG
jgi:hypothetical protein